MRHLNILYALQRRLAEHLETASPHDPADAAKYRVLKGHLDTVIARGIARVAS
jgi:hypothetical protein